MTADVVELVIVGRSAPGRMTVQEPVRSVLTGATLRRIAVSGLRIEGGEDDAAAEAIRRASTRPLLDRQGGQWLVETWSSTSVNDGPVNYALELIEYEHVTVDAVTVDGLTLPLTRHLADAGRAEMSLMVQLLFATDEAAHEALSVLIEKHYEAEDYFPVVLHGVRAEPVSMRFGQCVWEAAGSEYREFVVLVSEEGDDQFYVGVGQPDLARLKDAVVGQQRQFDALIEELHRAGVLPAEAIERIRRVGVGPFPRSQYRGFRRTGSLEDFLPDEWR
ncbi:hypothetical protein [Cryptosporangium phraense]|uniref:Uncharacterized protein n=1 Tax=Cryptosporangium phraense TaxID=2593070 RepID=A0A545AKH6_9ACTN|nr:hypothetical protein [Cryptosporangium phraense]TQS41826.1 hypothetical protein FL583_27725 [Cryptosporangium phraense]